MEDNKQEELTIVQNKEQGIGVFANAANFDTAQRMAISLSKSTMVPKIFQATTDNPNAVSNCIIALEMANRIGASPMMVMQNLYVVYGNPGWSSQFLISCVNSCGKYTGLKYEFCGKENTDEWGCRAYAIEKLTGEVIYGTWITIKLSKDEGWYGKSGSKWKTMPEQMLRYRAAAFWQRAHEPGLSMGFLTTEEYYDIGHGRNEKPIYVKPVLEPNTEDWVKTVQALKNGIKIEQVRAKFEIEEEYEVSLLNEAMNEFENPKNELF